MSSPQFRVVEHTVPCQHIREYARATAGAQEDALQLSVKQYIPLDNPNPKEGDITIIGGHANGFELYEPLWEEILLRAKKQNFNIRSIWIADVAQQGHSGVLNEDLLGNDPCWNDHARDLLSLINLKRDQMPRPIIGIGHSMGGNNLVNLSLMHPRLFTTLILLDPVLLKSSSAPPDSGENPARMSTFRRDMWPSRDAAAAGFKKSKFYQAWDPRVVDRLVRYGLRDLPTAIMSKVDSDKDSLPVTLTTTRHQEVFTFLRPNFEGSAHNGRSIDRKMQPDIRPGLPQTYPFYRPEVPANFLRLPELRPSVLYLFGELSYLSSPDLIQSKMDTTGVGVGGSGGALEGRVNNVVLKGVGHLVAMEAVEQCALAASDWIGKEIALWKTSEEEHRRSWTQQNLVEKNMVSDKWKEMIGGPPRSARSTGSSKL